MTIKKGIILKLLSFVLLTSSLSLFGQDNAKKNITTADYVKWGKLSNHMLSEKGNWISYGMQYDDLPDTVFLAGIVNQTKFTIPKANEGKFIGELLFVCQDRDRMLHLIDLVHGNTIKIPNVSSYEVSSSNRHIITAEQQQEGKNYLRIRDLKGKVLEQVEGIVEFKMNNARDAMVCRVDSGELKSIFLIKLAKAIVTSKIANEKHGLYSNLTWSESNETFAFVGNYQGEHFKQMIYHYSLLGSKLNEVDPNNNDSFPERFRKNARLSGITISPDDKRLIFSMRETDLPSVSNDTVQIWNGNDPLEYSWKKAAGILDVTFRLVVWWPQSGRVLDLADGDRPYAILNSSRDFALRYNYSKGAIQYQMERNVDFFVQDFESGKQEFLIENQTMRNSSMSSKGTYFAYFRNNEWWIYDFRKKERSKLPEPAGASWGEIEYAKESNAYGIAAWDSEEKYLLIYDRYDIWRVDLAGQIARRLTNGREKQIKFRAIFNFKKKYFLTTAILGNVVEQGQNILLSLVNSENETGFSILKPNGQLRQIAYGPSYYSNLSKAEKADKFLFLSQNQDSPPSLNYVDLFKQEKKQLFQSNAHHFNYHWGKQEIISYTNSKNKELSGILYYPADYDPLRKYPMLVFVYEEQNYKRHYYTNPSRYNMTGFNVSSLTAQGYFVLLPDIVYEIGNPGLSASDCVLAATNKVLSTGIVDKERIALMGQSFGGYETNFILTQTKLFRAAISGVSIFDLQCMYLSISESGRKSEIWRFESQQWRMGRSLFEDRKGYERNSPSTYVDNITTPLLIWAGEIDRQVNPNQSIALYLALRRLGKKNIMLMYPKESHSIMLKQNQVDLYNRINDWLAYYLKDEIPSEWISNGTK